MSKELILLEDVDGLGIVGEIVKVADGYARNYLLPRRLAQPFSEAARARLESRRQQRMAELASELEKMNKLAERIQDSAVTIGVKTSGGKLYGAVHESEIVKAAKEQGLVIDKKQIVLTEPLRELGEYSVEVRLHAKVEARLKVSIVEEE